MGCIYNDREGKCQSWDEEQDKGTTFENCDGGWNINGECVCEDDPDPGYSCAYYESDQPYEDEQQNSTQWTKITCWWGKDKT